MDRAGEKLFRAIRSKHEKVRPWKKETMEILGLGKSAFYNRVNGHTPLLLEEAILLSRHFEVPFQEIEDPNNSATFQPLEFSSFIDFLNYWHTFFENTTQSHPLMVFSRSLPLFPLFHSPVLLQINFENMPLSPLPSLTREITDLIELILKKISLHKRKEVWTTQLFHNYHKRLYDAVAQTGLPNPTDSNSLTYALQEMKFHCREQADLPLHAAETRISNTIEKTLPFCFLCCDPQSNFLVAEIWPNYWVEVRQPDFIKVVSWKVEHFFETGYAARFCIEDIYRSGE